MKKSIVALVIVLALVVLVSPGIIGRLAERSMDENLDWAATESDEVVVTSTGFDRGWFSSAGEHRVELRDGRLKDLLTAYSADGAPAELPALIIDTRLDHGLIPIGSMSREQGSLMPGLGSAVSTLHIESGDGSRVDLPGEIYSTVSLTGELTSNYRLPAGSFSNVGDTASWSDVDVTVTMDPSSGKLRFDGDIATLSAFAAGENVAIDGIEFAGSRQQSPFGFATGALKVSVRSASVDQPGQPTSLGPLSLESDSALRGERLDGHLKFRLDNTPVADFGTGNMVIDASVAGLDGKSLGRIVRQLEHVPDDTDPDALFMLIEDDLRRLMSSGFEFRFDRFDVELPQGPLTTKLRFLVAATDPDTFTWTSVLLALDASADVSIPAPLVDLLIAMEPQGNAVIGMGFLRKQGDFYEMHAAYKKGLLTVNGAPMPIPLPGVR
jgi:uncharacterized protein YdgA (DUF945 family)